MVEKLGKLEEIEKTATDIVGKTIRSLRHQQVSGVVHPASDFSGFGCRFLRRTLTVVFLYWFALLFLAVVVDVADVDVVFVVPFGVVSHRFRFFTVSDCFYLLKKTGTCWAWPPFRPLCNSSDSSSCPKVHAGWSAATGQFLFD